VTKVLAYLRAQCLFLLAVTLFASTGALLVAALVGRASALGWAKRLFASAIACLMAHYARGALQAAQKRAELVFERVDYIPTPHTGLHAGPHLRLTIANVGDGSAVEVDLEVQADDPRVRLTHWEYKGFPRRVSKGLTVLIRPGERQVAHFDLPAKLARCGRFKVTATYRDAPAGERRSVVVELARQQGGEWHISSVKE